MLTTQQIQTLVHQTCTQTGVNALYMAIQEDNHLLFYADVPVTIGWKLGGLYEDLKELFPGFHVHIATRFEDQEEYNNFLREQVKIYDKAA